MKRLTRIFVICVLSAAALGFSAVHAAEDGCLAIAYTGENYQGDSWEIQGAGEYDLGGGFELPNDSIRSIRVRPGYRVVLYLHSGFGGESVSFDGDTPLFVSEWRAQASSLSVESADSSDEKDAEDWLAAINAADGDEGGTLDALPKPDKAYIVIHADDLAYASVRIGHSFTFDELLGHRMEGGMILEALRRSPPVESISLIREHLSDKYHGAVRLTGHGRKLLDFLPGGDRAIGGEDHCEYLPFGPVLRVRIEKEEDNLFSFAINADAPFYLHLGFHASLGVDGKTLFIGSGAEEVKRAREVFESGEGRADITRHSQRKSFLLIEDTGDEDGDFALTEDFLRGMLDVRVTPSKGVSAEISCDLSESAIRLSLHHNLTDIILGDKLPPQAPVAADDPGLGFGGGTPWLAGSVGIDLNEDSLLDLMTGIAGGEKDDAREFLKSQGIDPATAATALRSLGIVLGGDYKYRGINLNGGYVFLSGDSEGLRQCKQFIEQAISSSFYTLEAVEREGWDLFYIPKTEEWEAELRARYGWGDSYFVGMWDGVLLAGALDRDHLLDTPEIGWSGLDDDGEGPALRISLSPATLGALLASLKGPQLWAVKAGMEASSMRRSEAEGIIKGLIHCQEIEKVTLDVKDRENVEVSIDTKDVDYKNAWELLRLQKTLSEMD